MPNAVSSPSENRSALGRPKDPLKRQGIIDAATELFMLQGFTLTSMDAVARRADVSKLTIYNHFDNKADLFKAVIQYRCDCLAAPNNFFNVVKLPVAQALRQLASTLAALIYNPNALHLQRIMYSEAIQHPEVIKIFYEAGPLRVKTAFAELLTEWHKQGQLDINDADKATEQFFSLLKGEVHTKAMMFLTANLNQQALDAHIQTTISAFLAIYHSKTNDGAA